MARKLRQINESLIGYEPEGREFESLRAHHSYQIVAAEIPIAELGPLGPTVKLSPALLAARRRYSSSYDVEDRFAAQLVRLNGVGFLI
jgi:hypothetical protein